MDFSLEVSSLLLIILFHINLSDILPIVVKIVPSFGMDYLTEQLSAMTTNPTHMTTPTNEQLLYDVHSDGLEDQLTIQTLSPLDQYNSTTEMMIENPQVDMTPVGPLPLDHCTSLPDAPLIVDHCSPPIDHCTTNYINDNSVTRTLTIDDQLLRNKDT